MEGMLIMGALIAALFLTSLFVNKRYKAERARIQRLQPVETRFSDTLCKATTYHPTQNTARWQSAYVFLSDKRLVIYKKRGDDQPILDCSPHRIEGFWRPSKYQSGENEIEIHASINNHLRVVNIKMQQSAMMGFIRALKEVVSADVIKSYRQRRPYTYKQPEKAAFASQNVYGVWEIGEPFVLYLTPLSLIFFALPDVERTLRIIRLRDIQNITIIKRIDRAEIREGESDGLLAFDVLSTGEHLVIAVQDYEAWAQAIALAAKRTLEEPVSRKQKSVDAEASTYLTDDINWINDEQMEIEWFSKNFTIGDDGELHFKK